MRWATITRHLAGVVALLGDLLLRVPGDDTLRWGTAAPSWLIPVGSVVCYLPLVVQPASTLRNWLVLWGFGIVVGIGVPSDVPLLGLCVALFRIAATYPTRRSVQILILTIVPFELNSFNSIGLAQDRSTANYVTSAIVWAAVACVAWGAGRISFLSAARAREQAQLYVAESTAALRTERLRLARELHDIISHSVSAMILQAAGARAGQSDEARMRTTLEAVETTGVQAMRELHRLLGLLRSVEEHGGEDASVLAQETLANLDPLLDAARACDVDVHVEVEGTPRPLDPSIDHTAYRMVQECLANVIKHAGRQADARVRISWESPELLISVRSTPGLVGAEARPDLSTGLGLRGLTERIELVGGRFEAGPAADGAFIASARLPWARASVRPTSAVESR